MATIIGFGKHKDMTVWEVPQGYCQWLAEKFNPYTEHGRIVQLEAKDVMGLVDDCEQQYYANEMRYDQ